MADLGLAREAEEAFIKLQASLPAGARQQAEFARQRILIDTRGWLDPAESIACQCCWMRCGASGACGLRIKRYSANGPPIRWGW